MSIKMRRISCIITYSLLIVSDGESFLPTLVASQRTRSNNRKESKSRLFVEKERVVFGAAIVETTTPLDSNKIEEVIAFFKDKACLNHFLSAGGSSKLNEEEFTPEFEQFWKNACENYYGDEYLPDPSCDSVITSETIVQFPGLQLFNTVSTGVKLVESEPGTFSNNIMPMYQAVMIAEKQRVKGPAPLVWIFKQLTGNAKKKDDEFSKPSGSALTKITVKETGPNEYCLHMDCNVQIIVEFPKTLIRILPTSKEKMEEQGGNAIKKAVRRDIIKCIETTNDTFLKWKVDHIESVPTKE